MIEVQLCGRLGNHLFQYATCRSLAEKKGLNFWVNPSGWGGFDLFNVTFGKRDGVCHTKYQETKLEYDSRIEDVGDFTTLMGFFQSEKYFDHNKARMWFEIFPPNDSLVDDIIQKYPHEEYCYINIRGGDVKFISSQKLKKEYFLNGMDRMREINSVLKFVIITDDPPYAKEYFPNIPILNNSLRTDFLLMHRAKYLIMANSSMCWWASWLNPDNIVIAPHGWLNVNINKWEFSPRDIKVDRWEWI